MKNVTIRIASLLLLLLIAASSLCSCSLGDHYGKNSFPEGYTGGFGIPPGSEIEYYWVETYAEAVEAINLLKSHGSTFLTDNILTYDGDMFDTKYCFAFFGQKDKIIYGENPYDRWASEIEVLSYAFFEEVSVEEISYSLLKYYDAYSFNANECYIQSAQPIKAEDINFQDWGMEHNKYVREIYHNEELILDIESCFYDKKEVSMTDEFIVELILKGKIIQINEGWNDEKTHNKINEKNYF